MSRVAVLLILVLALGIVLLWVMGSSLYLLQRMVVVESAQGKVEAMRKQGSGWEAVSAGMPLAAGSRLRTGDDGYCTIVWVNGARAKLDPNSEFRITACHLDTRNKQELNRCGLQSGRTWVRVPRLANPASRFEIATPCLVARVTGTVFALAIGEREETLISVYEGKVNVVVGGKAAPVGAGEEMAVPKDAHQPPSSRPASPQVREGWEEHRGLLAPYLEVENPGETSTDQAEIEVRGRAESTAAVTVAGQEAVPDSRGRFAVKVPLKMGSNIIAIEAKDSAGQTKVITITVTRTGPSTGQ